MELKHSFTLPIPPEEAWNMLTDLERVAPCMPGATLESVEDGTYKGSVKVKVGPMQMTYRGEVTFVEQDETERSATIDASGRETRGPGTAKATVRMGLQQRDDGTLVTVDTTLQVTGRPAQFGRGVMEEVGNKLLGQFAECLATQFEPAARTAAVPPPGAAADTPTADAGKADGGHLGTLAPSAESVDLLGVAGIAVVRRLAPLAAAAVALILLLRRRRR